MIGLLSVGYKVFFSNSLNICCKAFIYFIYASTAINLASSIFVECFGLIVKVNGAFI